MNNTRFTIEKPLNETVYDYGSGSAQREGIRKELKRQESCVVDIPLIIGGREVRTGNTGTVVMPCDHSHVLATYHKAGEEHVSLAIEAALKAREEWATLSWVERASISMKAADLLASRYRFLINAATMLGQGKNMYQAEIDAAAETVDFLRFNAWFASQVYSGQPGSTTQQLNRLEYRPLEGFVFTVSPFNFTSIASNLNMSVALMGNTAVWKPATTSLLSSYYLMKVFMEAGVPEGVINFLPGRGSLIGERVLTDPSFAGLHFTGSNATFNGLWRMVASNLEIYRNYPRLVGETGGKDFIFVHSSADPAEVATAIVRGAFEYQGQKCSAASRAYIPESLWDGIRDRMLDMLAAITVGDSRDNAHFVNAVIDEYSFDNIMGYIGLAKDSSSARILAGGKGDKTEGYYIEPTVILTEDPFFRTMQEEIFGPVMTVFVYPDDRFPETLDLCDRTSPYALTGAVFSRDRYAFVKACRALRYAAGNFYLNDKPTGAVVGLQPFGGARASGTNDKAGGPLNLLRWVSPRTIKETFIPATDYPYPFMD
ncbi:MAG: L-glutamate gamma-semialdehyde dehydrogenase [Candidatus Fermentibacteraceae bacterium]|nr:L-glutamate gamma-semialdehyde dehydrogenase [Candidatus Fermentibacteraceae bacterium]MBN2607803.1 L-glutamate gamma-semialdehyde dehydrogenase [Candidatus Fermentibacteraceae bacterium]